MNKLQESKISWYVSLDNTNNYKPTNEIFAGTYNSKKNLKVALRLWNNRYGMEDVQDLENFSLHIFFENTEDSALLKYCSAILNKEIELNFQIIKDYGVLTFPDKIKISGKKNNGFEEENEENFLTIDFKFNIPSDLRLKEHDLKSLYFELIKN